MPETATSPGERMLAVASFLRGGGDRTAAINTLEQYARALPVPDTRPALTTKQARVLAFIREHIGARGCAPTLEAIADKFGYRSISTVHGHLTNLEAAGYITRGFNQPQAITLNEAAQ